MRSYGTGRNAAVSFGRTAVVTGWVALSLAACASMPRVFTPGPAPTMLVGEWTAGSTAADTTVWRLGPDGTTETRVISSRTRSSALTRIGRWYVTGDVDDAAARKLCFVQRAGRDGASCMHFQFDTLTANGIARRRLILAPNWKSDSDTRHIALVERLP